jgi:hypothetical protein
MNKKEKTELYIRTYDKFVDLVNGKIDKVIITPAELLELDYVALHNEVICDNNGNFVCKYIDGRYTNCADILRQHFGDKIVQEIDIATGNYIFRKGSGVNE